MQARLRAAGVRPISNIVDVTNYVLLELGQPMHAFDLARLGGGQIRVRTAQPGETLRTLDGQMRDAHAGDARHRRRRASGRGRRRHGRCRLRGHCRHDDRSSSRARISTPLSVRRTSKALGLKTEASIRFERGTDPRLPVTAMERACALLELIGAGTARGTIVDRYPLRASSRSSCGCVADAWRRLLGVSVPDPDVRRILESLGLRAARRGATGWDVTVPTRRVDVLREVDLIEEVARHYGFDRIPVTFPALTAAPPPIDPRITQARALRSIMTGAGFSEAVTFGFVAESAAAPFAAAEDLVPIANPLSETFAVLRPSILPGLVDAVAHNRRREQRDVRLFEIGARFSRSARRAARAGVRLDRRGRRRSLERRHPRRRLLRHEGRRRARLPGAATWTCRSSRSPSHGSCPDARAAILAGGTRIGSLGQLAPSIVEQHGAAGVRCDLRRRDSIWTACPSCDERSAGRAAAAVPVGDARHLDSRRRHAAGRRRVRRTIREHAPAILVRVSEFDRYQGKGVPDGQVSLSLRLTFRARRPHAHRRRGAGGNGRRARRAQGTPRRGATLDRTRRCQTLLASCWRCESVGNWVLRSWELSWHHLPTLPR